MTPFEIGSSTANSLKKHQINLNQRIQKFDSYYRFVDPKTGRMINSLGQSKKMS